MAQNCGKMRGFAAILGRLRRSTNENYRTFLARLGDFCAQRASLTQIFRSKGALGCNFSALHGALDAILRYNCGRTAKNLALLAARRQRRRTRDGDTAMQLREHLLQQASQFIVEQRELCDLLRQQAVILSKTLAQARELRVDFLQTLLLLRRRVREYAERNGVDERLLMQCVMKRLRLSQFLDTAVLSTLIKHARRLEKVYMSADFESVSLDSAINEFLQLRDDPDAATKLRDYMRAIVRQYVDVTDRSEAIRFLRELAAQLEMS